MSRLMFIFRGLGVGGVESVIVNLCKGLSNHERYVLLLHDDVRCPVQAKTISINSRFEFVHVLFKIKRIKREINPHYVISANEPFNLFNVLTKVSGQRTILSFHGHKTKFLSSSEGLVRGILWRCYQALRCWYYKFIFKRLYNKADLLVAVSRGVAKDLVDNFGADPSKVRVIYNPFLIEDIEFLSQESLGEYEPIFNFPVIITVGRLARSKGQWHLLRVFRPLKDRYPSLKLVILGEGKLKGYLVDLSSRLGLKTHVWDRDALTDDYDVYFLGFQRNPFKFLSRSKLFVLPSLGEGLSNALIEAMASSLPVISADCRSGPREILAPDTDLDKQAEGVEFAPYGVLMPPFDGKLRSANDPLDDVELMWVSVLDRLLTDEELRKSYSLRARQRALDFSLERIVKEWERVFSMPY